MQDSLARIEVAFQPALEVGLTNRLVVLDTDPLNVCVCVCVCVCVRARVSLYEDRSMVLTKRLYATNQTSMLQTTRMQSACGLQV